MKFLIGLFVWVLFLGCNSSSESETREYTLIKSENEKAVMFLFPCFPCNAEHTKSEAKFIDDLVKNRITVVLLNENKKLFLSEDDEKRLGDLIKEIIFQNEISTQNIVFGGFSSGGNLALNLSGFLLENSSVKPQSVFVVDSPIDLEQLYENCKSDIEKNFNNDAVQEAKFVVELLERELGKPNENIYQYLKYSPYLNSHKDKINLEKFRRLKIRFYTEPDVLWQKEQRKRTQEETNYFQLKNANEFFTKNGLRSELILTKNRGYRTNGERHPHSWNIIEGVELINWILNQN